MSLDVLAAGRYVIESTNATGQPEVVVVEVLGVQTQNSSSLALTGSDAGPTMVLAIFCIAVGLLLTVRRRSPR